MEDLADDLRRQIRNVRRREQGLYMLLADEIHELLPARAIKLAHDVVEEEDGIFSRF